MNDRTEPVNKNLQSTDDSEPGQALAMRLVDARKRTMIIKQVAHDLDTMLARGITSLVDVAQVWDLTNCIKSVVVGLEKAVCELTGSGPPIPGARTPDFLDLAKLGD
jgi:hypothetical protein